MSSSSRLWVEKERELRILGGVGEGERGEEWDAAG